MNLNSGGFSLPPILPALPPESLSTFSVRARMRRGTCEEARCPRWDVGWETRVDEATDLGARQAGYIRRLAGRRFEERREGSLTIFTFYPGQQCFEQHTVSAMEAPRYLKVGGDPWRGNPRGEFVEHRTMDDWINDFGEHQERLKRAQS